MLKFSFYTLDSDWELTEQSICVWHFSSMTGLFLRVWEMASELLPAMDEILVRLCYK
jgi:hypothetical protein